MFNYNKKIIVNYRKGTSDDPYVNINESHIVNPDGKVILTEIPLEFNRVIATSADGERYYEIQEGIPKDNEYKVDYINKIVTFSPNNIGKQFNFDYIGIGQHYLPVDMIYTEENNGIVTETLKQLTDSTKQARDNANEAADNATTQAQYAQTQGNFALAQGQYAQQVGDENKTRWLTAVNTYADIATTYPNPQLGDTVQTIDDSKIYRWNGTQWVWTQQYNANAITDVQNKIGILQRKTSNLHVDVTDFENLILNKNVVADSKLWDWTPAIQAAIDYAIQNKIKTVFFPDRYYLVDGTITVSEPLNLLGVYMVETSKDNYIGGSVIVAGNSTTDFVISISKPYPNRIVGFNIMNLSFLGSRSWTDDDPANWVDRPCLELKGIAREFQVYNVHITGFKRGAVVCESVFDGNFFGLTITYCGTDVVYPALHLKGDGRDNSNACRFFGLHIEHCPYFIKIEGSSRHIQFIAPKFELGSFYSTNPLIVIDNTALEVVFIAPQCVTANAFFYRDRGVPPQYFFLIENDMTIITNGMFSAPPDPGWDGALWINHTGNGGDFSHNIFNGCHGGDYAIKLGSNVRFKDNDLYILTSNDGVKNGIRMLDDNHVSGNKFFEVTGHPVTSGIQYKIDGAANFIKGNRTDKPFTKVWEGAVVNEIEDNHVYVAITSINNGVLDVGGRKNFEINVPTPTTITNFTSGHNGQTIEIFVDNSNITIENNANIGLKGGTNVTLSAGSVITLKFISNRWWEQSRSF